MFYAAWAGNVVHVSSLFAWYCCFFLINVCQILYEFYRRRTISIPTELQQIYSEMFRPLGVSISEILRESLVGAGLLTLYCVWRHAPSNRSVGRHSRRSYRRRIRTFTPISATKFTPASVSRPSTASVSSFPVRYSSLFNIYSR